MYCRRLDEEHTVSKNSTEPQAVYLQFFPAKAPIHLLFLLVL